MKAIDVAAVRSEVEKELVRAANLSNSTGDTVFHAAHATTIAALAVVEALATINGNLLEMSRRLDAKGS